MKKYEKVEKFFGKLELLPENQNINNENFDYSFVKNPARIAVYDDLKAPPRIIQIDPCETNKFIESLTSTVYEESQRKTGKIPYTVIREICENFIHAQFSEIVVSILDNGNTIRFADQGPGFADIEKAKLPGFTSAKEEMKSYIRGVGSGLPTVSDYIKYTEGHIKIENNLRTGSVVTISLLENLSTSTAFSEQEKQQSNNVYQQKLLKMTPNLSQREQDILLLIYKEGQIKVSEVHNVLNIPNSSVHNLLTKLESAGLVLELPNKTRTLTDYGFEITKLL